MKKLNIFILILCLFVPLSFSGCKNSNKKTLSTPTILEIKGGTIVFNAVTDAEYYTLYINENTINIDANYNSYVQLIDNHIHYDASKIFVVGDSYSIKVQANATKKQSSAFSNTYAYKHQGTIKKPENVKINKTTLTWDPVENANYYNVKIITPNDNVILDKNGNILTQDDSLSISNADLTEYSFNTNQFDFSSLLSKAGSYKFYVNAVMTDEIGYIESGYTSKVIYSHTVELKTPVNGKVSKIDGELHLATAVDPNANAVSIKCNEFEQTMELNCPNSCITKASENYFDINLNKFFESYISAGNINFNQFKQFNFSTQARFLANNLENSYYLNSAYSSNIIFENTHILTAPTLKIEHNSFNDCYVANWTMPQNEIEFLGEFKVLVATETEIKEYKLDNNISSMLLTEDFIAVAVQAIGVGNYLNSPLSDFVSSSTVTNTLPNPNFNIANFALTWDNIADYYIAEIGNEYFVLNTSNFDIDIEKFNSNNPEIKFTAIKANNKALTKIVDITYSNQLASPTFSYSQGFTSSKLYELTFTGVENSIGYYVYIKSQNDTEYTKINTLYTSTAIDLSQYIISEGEFTDYLVKVQAVADLNSVYSNSELSTPVNVSHVKVLDTPEFYKLSNITAPVIKQNSNGTTKYFLKFYGVKDAGSYEILINFNKLTIVSRDANDTDLYSVDISNYLIAANNYEIKVRAVPNKTTFNVEPSEYNTTSYALTKQLSTVTNIQVTENEGVYTLSFDPIDNAEEYKVRIVKENDPSYVDYLHSHGLSHTFNIKQSTDISQYVKQQGVYYFYVTALAPKENSYYADSNESSTYGYVNKLTSLESPKNIKFSNISKDSYLLSWTGDDHADYYLVKLTDPNNISYEFKVYSSTSTNINRYMTIQGTYKVSIYSMVNAVGSNASHYTASSGTDASEHYIYTTEQDFIRYSVRMYGFNYNFTITTANELKNLLWYHYLYKIDSNTSLSLYINRTIKEDQTTETLREAILRLAEDANTVYPFASDAGWDNLIKTDATDNELFSYLCEKLIISYPEFNILEDFELEHTTNSQVFSLKYKNALNIEKVTDETSLSFTNTNYGNKYNYIDLYSRRSSTGVFKIDAREEVLVTTTEQLLQAVQHGRKPKFIGNSEVAETVYNNAKLVLSAIITNNMSDLEKVTAIFDWLEYGFDITYYEISARNYISGSVEANSVANYGKYKQYYLEGIFENITMLPNGNIVIGSNKATSWSYSKAFALLCAIEGIDASIIYGEYSYYDVASTSDKVVKHTWNKVYLDPTVDKSGANWFAVDLTFSDNRVYFNNFTNGYGIASHSYFLTTDSMNQLNLNLTEKSHLISNDYANARKCNTKYDYYTNSSFALTKEQISNTIKDFETGSTLGFEYAKKFSQSTTYQKYSGTTGYGTLEAFLLNSMIYAEYQADHNGTNKSVFEFKFAWSDNGNSSNFTDMIEDFEAMFTRSVIFNTYGIKLNLIIDVSGGLYSVQDTENSTTTFVYIVEKAA